MRRRAFLRAVESLIAIVMVLASFQIFLNWEGVGVKTSASETRQTGYDLLAAYSPAMKTALFDFPTFADFISAAVPSSMAHAIQGEFFVPISVSEGFNTIYLDFPATPDAGTIRVTDLTSTEYPSSAEFPFYRVPFLLENRGSPAANAPFYVSVSLPPLDSGRDGILEPTDPNSFDLFLGGSMHRFSINRLVDINGTLTATILFNASLAAGEAKQGYLYFKSGRPALRILPVEWIEYDTSGQKISIALRSIERAPRGEISFQAPADGRAFVTFSVGGSPSAAASSSGVSASENSTHYLLNNSLLLLAVDKSSGAYALADPAGAELLSARQEILGQPLSAVTSPPALVAAGGLTVRWQASSDNGRTDYFATLYPGERTALVQRKTVLRAYGSVGYSSDKVHLSSAFSLAETYPSFPPFADPLSLRSALVLANGTDWLRVASDLRRNVQFNGTDIIPDEAREVTQYNFDDPIYSATLYSLSNASLAANSTPSFLFRSDDPFNVTTSLTVIYDSSTTLPFDYSHPAGQAAVLMNFTIRRRFNNTVALSCSVNGDKRVFEGLVIPPFLLASEEKYFLASYLAPASWFAEGANQANCSVNATNITIESLKLLPTSFPSLPGEIASVRFFSNGSADLAAGAMLNLTRLGAPAGMPIAFDSATGDLEAIGIADLPSRTISVRATIPPNATVSKSLFFPSIDGFELALDTPFGSVSPYTPLSLGYNPAASAAVDIGEITHCSSTYSQQPAYSAEYIGPTLSQTAEATVSQKFVVDPETGRAASIKLVLWRKS